MEYDGGASKGSRKLVIDDDPDITAHLTTILKPQDFVVYQACDGIEGLKNAYELHPDLINLDIMMPGIDASGGMHSSARINGISNSDVDGQGTMIHI